MAEELKPTKRVTLPRYQQIAVDIAERIVENRYKVGQKIHARSTLASNFNVSPETARKAINVLVDLEIMEVQQGSGTYVASRENAQLFVEKYKNVQSIQEIRQDLLDSVQRQRQELNSFSELLNVLVNQTKKVHDISTFVPFELKLTAEAQHLEESVADLNIWQITGATIVGIQTDVELLLSPGPYAKLSVGNTIYFVGSELSVQRMTQLFYPNEIN
ncbi:GntR family transcriptional regulator [Tetragenococcus koreensis]|uniref:GntR family transcriptional regulator n=1 Tax=Tetragenococcus koreensis TaxID=290335 RepID=UPI000F4F119E|nr:GntR family transcriptional regulator [Tetragenococcus koreensis]AYW45428.1 GntR family transcriptional regulator [Tetragenococcus koreensis]MDN6470550.1 GntR family transcriptional regulator [Tetragenococcus koreensis]MDN6664559.1 GntR family transcriptional regulator [Tetragenococcus koreensis]GEN90542.1 GntR family transcriptional regulator [Tetragenococcus koreensis]